MRDPSERFGILFSFLRSMKLGLVLLGTLGVFSIIGSFIPQGRDAAFYHNHYSSIKANTILTLKLDDIYHSFSFIILFGTLCLNLFLCSISRLNQMLKKIREIPNYKSLKKINEKKIKGDLQEETIEGIFKSYGFKKVKQIQKDNKETVYYSYKNKISYLGSWLTHTGILLIIVFYGYGQFTYFTTGVYGVPGETKEVQGTNYRLEINDFNIQYREDGTVEQYISQVDLKKQDGSFLKTTDIYVNNPMRHNGYAFYQTATGWATDIKIYKGEDLVMEDTFYESTSIIDQNLPLVIQFTKFYPDYLRSERGITTVSNQLNNPKVLYSLFYMGQRVAMNVTSIGEPIYWHDYTFIFNNPQNYTYFQVNKMRGKLGAMMGSVSIMIGLFLCFYRKPEELVILSKGNNLHIYGNNENIKGLI